MSGTTSALRGDAASSAARLLAVAALGAALHGAGLVLAALAMRPGTPAAPLLERLVYLARRPGGWVAGWLVWVACAATLVVFMALLARARPSSLTRAAALLTAAGAVVDVAGDLTYAFVLPARAAGDVASFLRFERGLSLASLTAANGLYSIAILVATLGLPRRWTAARRLGFLTFAGGAWLAWAGVTGDPRHVALATAVTIPSFVAWTLAVAAAVRRQ
jgi:hypothetical protein